MQKASIDILEVKNKRSHSSTGLKIRLDKKRQKKIPLNLCSLEGGKKTLAATYSSILLCIVPSAMKGLTSEFGMGSGITPSPWPPRLNLDCRKSQLKNLISQMKIDA